MKIWLENRWSANGLNTDDKLGKYLRLKKFRQSKHNLPSRMRRDCSYSYYSSAAMKAATLVANLGS
jgi:hypothetical protein